ncbi:hypothetical protein VTL71DRAFT_3160 [Oculimacula yallundae]|uniref:Uncharacterized protein n=1 Tax=Oculimacula yallundae TaxID=86028 RepID=A0ABR4C6B3_9HELO
MDLVSELAAKEEWRTTRNAESDENWDLVLERINTHVVLEVNSELLRHTTLNPEPNQIIISKFKNKSFEDKNTLEGASLEPILNTFAEWKAKVSQDPSGKRPSMSLSFKACVVIDEEALRMKDLKPSAFVKLVGNNYLNEDPDSSDDTEGGEDCTCCMTGNCDPDYHGWFKADIRKAWYAFERMTWDELNEYYGKDGNGSLLLLW